jgi:hypothetical protein
MISPTAIANNIPAPAILGRLMQWPDCRAEAGVIRDRERSILVDHL